MTPAKRAMERGENNLSSWFSTHDKRVLEGKPFVGLHVREAGILEPTNVVLRWKRHPRTCCVHQEIQRDPSAVELPSFIVSASEVERKESSAAGKGRERLVDESLTIPRRELFEDVGENDGIRLRRERRLIHVARNGVDEAFLALLRDRLVRERAC